jgi:hypothetical protein
MYTLSADLSRGRDKNSYVIYDDETKTIVYSGDDLDEVRKYGFKTVVVDEQDTDLLFKSAKSNK